MISKSIQEDDHVLLLDKLLHPLHRSIDRSDSNNYVPECVVF